MLPKTAILLLALALSSFQAPLQAANHSDNGMPEIQCLLAVSASDGRVTIVKALCGAEYLPVRTCYVFTGKVTSRPGVQRGDPVRFRLDGSHLSLKFHGNEKWMSFDTITNHVHLFADSREWPARPDGVALTVCASVPPE